jgi:hypothetical protein
MSGIRARRVAELFAFLLLCVFSFPALAYFSIGLLIVMSQPRGDALARLAGPQLAFGFLTPLSSPLAVCIGGCLTLWRRVSFPVRVAAGMVTVAVVFATLVIWSTFKRL